MIIEKRLEMANDIAQICPDLVENACGEANCVSCITSQMYLRGYHKIPCKLGDEVWAIRNYSGTKKAVAGKVSEMYFIEEMTLIIVVKNVARGKWGEKIFATREECERAINEH
jgi:hypothetical protein